MKLKNPLAALFGWIALGVGPAPAADDLTDAAASSVFGRVRNVATGQYLNKARVSLKGTTQEAFTDESGLYRITHARSGPSVLEVYYPDLDRLEIPLDLRAGAAIERNIDLSSVERYGQGESVVKLDAYVVAMNKETDAEAIATSEQRFAPNVKNVMPTNALGVLMVGGAGEMLKFIPGVTAEYDNTGVRGISIRGIGGAMTSVLTDGAEIVSSASSAPTRSTWIAALTLNEISRIDTTKVPTPANAADSLAGTVNLIRKSAFEKSKPELNFGVTVVGNHEDFSFKKSPQGNGDKRVYKTLPGFDFTYTLPVTKDFGVVVTGVRGYKYHDTESLRGTWAATGASTNASLTNPYLQSYLLVDGGKRDEFTTLSLKADWRVRPHAVLSVGATYKPSGSAHANMQYTPSVGTNGAPTPATGTPFSFGPDFTTGAAGRGSVTIVGISQTSESEVSAADIAYRFDDGTWKFDVGINGSRSFWRRVNAQSGHFHYLNAALIPTVRVSFANINGAPVIKAFDATNREVDLYDIRNYRITSGRDLPMTTSAQLRSGFVNLRRQLNQLPFPAALQVGGAHKLRQQDNELTDISWNYNGPDGNPATTADQGAEAFPNQAYVNPGSMFGIEPLPWVANSRAFAAWKADPRLFSQTAAQVVAAENSRLTNAEYFEESTSAVYLQAEARLLANRLRVVTGVRYETTTDRGEGSLFDPNAVYQRNPDGTFVRNAQGVRVRKPEAGAVGSLEELSLTRKERDARSNKSYDGYYPSLHFTYDLRENFLLRLAYARTYGRPDFTDIVPRTVIQEADLTGGQVTDPSVSRGNLTVRNPSLRPWTADNYDLSLEYYTKQAGVFSVGVFDKEIKNFFGDASRIATVADLEEVGLDAQYVGWNLTTSFNSGDARIWGGEFNIRQSLRGLGHWGSHFTLFANGTKLYLEGNQGASFTSFIPTSGNWGGSFNMKRLSFTARWNHRGKDKRSPQAAYGADGYEYLRARTSLDLNFSFQITPRLSFVTNFNNVFHVHEVLERYGSQTPEYARQFQDSRYASLIAFGVRGSY